MPATLIRATNDSKKNIISFIIFQYQTPQDPEPINDCRFGYWVIRHCLHLEIIIYVNLTAVCVAPK